MMGAHHAITGAAAWIAVAGTAPYLTTGLDPVGTVGVFTGALVCAGAALLPDVDHHNATIAHSVPVVGSIVAGAAEVASGGHRHFTHGLLAAVAAYFGSQALNLAVVHTSHHGNIQVGAGIATAALIAFAAKALKLTRGSWALPWLFGAAIAAAVLLWSPQQILWLPIAITLGYVVHLLGDGLTTAGMPWLWPWHPKPPHWWQNIPILNTIWKPNGYMAFPILGDAGSLREWVLCAFVSLYVLYCFVYEGFWAFGVNLLTLMK
ncbi:metal-dependent hydrolase [Curtobacterium sp. MCBD17_040]|uniref:metal-dependent hydrolase n=1 Tax=Curtobacterium sp. MCBD17_040 TaxID=2175674 RepID=UPI000DA8603C|nr:metal-dependent hydrolase [Curtobacterium sp. MCBD17_040]WIB65686.1 metal-dependent hydrolase [Curtobacterium sp. MCBD17_040]